MANAKKFKLFCFEVDSKDYDFPVTNVIEAQKLINRGYQLYAFGRVNGSENTTRTSRVKEILHINPIHIITQNSDYVLANN